MNYYPILISVYDRINHIKQCVLSLQKCIDADKLDLYIVSDAAHSVDKNEDIAAVRKYLSSIAGFKSVTVFSWPRNLGPLNSIRKARHLVFEEHNALIFMEDDNIVSPYFYQYMNWNLTKWYHNEKVLYVCGYNYPMVNRGSKYDITFIQEFNAWGFGEWKHKFVDVSNLPRSYFDSANLKKFKSISHSSYYIVKSDLTLGRIYGDGRRAFRLVKESAYAVFPRISLVKNIGHDGSGLHCGTNDVLQNQPLDISFSPSNYPSEICLDYCSSMEVTKYRRYSLIKRFRIMLGRIYNRGKICFIKK